MSGCCSSCSFRICCINSVNSCQVVGAIGALRDTSTSSLECWSACVMVLFYFGLSVYIIGERSSWRTQRYLCQPSPFLCSCCLTYLNSDLLEYWSPSSDRPCRMFISSPRFTWYGYRASACSSTARSCQHPLHSRTVNSSPLPHRQPSTCSRAL